MDAVKFLEEAKRICSSHEHCNDCPFESYDCSFGAVENPQMEVEIVEKWASEHPVKTRQSEFLKMFPNAEIKKGVVNIYPCSIDTVEVQGSGEYCQFINGGCDKCKEAYWLAEVE